VHVDAVLWTDKDDNPWTTFIDVEAEDGVIKKRTYRTFAGFVSHSD
jgi:major membrane immunogen (membrane-anchored lipoprotein)